MSACSSSPGLSLRHCATGRADGSSPAARKSPSAPCRAFLPYDDRDLQTEVRYPPPHEEPMNGLTENWQQRLEEAASGSLKPNGSLVWRKRLLRSTASTKVPHDLEASPRLNDVFWAFAELA